jgi:HK97 family phage major capsid protein
MDELEKLLEKFNKEMKANRADMEALKAAQQATETLIKAQGASAEKTDRVLAEIKQAVDAKAAAIEELKSLVRLTESEVEKVDPLYMGTSVPGVPNRTRAFPNAKRAKEFGLFVMARSEQKLLAEKAMVSLHHSNKALAEAVNSTGGALAPEVFEPTLIRLQEQYGAFRGSARVVPMAGERVAWPMLDGHITVYYPGEAGTITASNPTFKNVQLIAKKACALTLLSSEIDEDSAVALGEIVLTDFARGFARAEDETGFLGDGSATYWGFTGAAGALRGVDATIGSIKSLVVASGNAYSEIILGDFDELVGSYPTFAEDGNVRWRMSKYFYWTVVRPLIMAYSSNIPTIGAPADIAGDRQPTFLGYPVDLIHVMPKTEANSQVCATLANLNLGAYLGDRRGFEVVRSREAYFTTDQVAMRATRRHAINVFGVGDTTDPGPVTGLITAAS